MLKESVAVLIRSPSQPEKVLLVRRPDTDPELPGLWGLPAASLQPGEGDLDALERLAHSKLGITLHSIRLCCEGEQQRPQYRLRMRLYEALPNGEPVLPSPSSLAGITLYEAWRWGELSELRASASAGSLCSFLALQWHAA